MDNISGGILAVDKAAGMTSFDVVAAIRRLYMTRQVGHTGTLDPMATGVMAVAVGRAVKLSEFIMAEDKCYSAGIKLGITSDTLDITGKIVENKGAVIPDENEFSSVLDRFRGKISQLPPMYSAIKVGGVKLCDAARKGIEIERKEREIEIYSLGYEKISPDEYRLSVKCSKGTYIRTLCDDIGKALGCGAVMSSLRRERCGKFAIEDCKTLEELEKMSEGERLACLVPAEELFSDLPKVELPDFFAGLAKNGNPISLRKIGYEQSSDLVRLYGGGKLFALAKTCNCGELGVCFKPIRQL